MPGSERFTDGGEPEVPLEGGDVTEGVVRVGATVRRPAAATSALVGIVLDHLESVGFTGAPRYLGVDRAGRDVLDFVEGETAGRPWPSWVADEARLVSLARLVRVYDDAMLPLGIPQAARDARRADPPEAPASVAPPPEFLAHADITPENVVFRDGLAAALIDFDLVRPATRVEELVNLLTWWAPWLAPEDRQPVLRDADAAHRARLAVDAYGLDPVDRALLVPVARNGAERSWHTMRDRAEALGGGWRRMWDEGIGDVILRRRDWLAENATGLEAALLDGAR